jgi:hypothetical protein
MWKSILAIWKEMERQKILQRFDIPDWLELTLFPYGDLLMHVPLHQLAQLEAILGDALDLIPPESHPVHHEEQLLKVRSALYVKVKRNTDWIRAAQDLTTVTQHPRNDPQPFTSYDQFGEPTCALPITAALLEVIHSASFGSRVRKRIRRSSRRSAGGGAGGAGFVLFSL